MAKDTLCLLDYVGWTEDRSISIAGTSLGGMIALGNSMEMSCYIFCAHLRKIRTSNNDSRANCISYSWLDNSRRLFLAKFTLSQFCDFGFHIERNSFLSGKQCLLLLGLLQ